MSRQESNRELLYILEDLIQHNPDLRFSQILQSYAFIKPQRPVKDPGQETWQNEFNVEPEYILERVKKRIEDIEYQNENVKGFITAEEAKTLLEAPLGKDENIAGRIAVIMQLLDPNEDLENEE